MRDDRLLKLLRTDPELGMKTLMDLYAGLVYTVVKGRLASSVFCTADIEDCVANTFTEFYFDLDKYTPDKGSIKAWLCIIAKNNALDMLRRHYRKAPTLSLNDEAATQYADDFSLEGSFEEKHTRKELVKAIQKLGRTDREILLRKYFLCQSSKEIAAAMGMNISGVDTRSHRAIKKLRGLFGGDCL